MHHGRDGSPPHRRILVSQYQSIKIRVLQLGHIKLECNPWRYVLLRVQDNRGIVKDKDIRHRICYNTHVLKDIHMEHELI